MLSEHHLTVPRTARYVVLGGANGAVTDLWFACHGYGQRAAGFAPHFAPIATDSCRVVVPEALSRFYLEQPDPAAHAPPRVGASWMTREDRQAEINDYVEYLNALWRHVRTGAAEGARLTVLGFSQGASTAARWAVLGEAEPSQLVIWGGSMPRELLSGAALEKLRRIPIVIIAGKTDRYATEEAVGNEQQAFGDAGLTPRFVRFDGGHSIDAGVLTELAESVRSPTVSPQSAVRSPQ